MGSPRRAKSHSKLTQTIFSLVGLSSLARSLSSRSAKEFESKRVPHQGQFSSGIGDGLLLGSALNCRTLVRAASDRPSPLCPRMFGVAALPTQRPISKGHSP